MHFFKPHNILDDENNPLYFLAGRKYNFWRKFICEKWFIIWLIIYNHFQMHYKRSYNFFTDDIITMYSFILTLILILSKSSHWFGSSWCQDAGSWFIYITKLDSYQNQSDQSTHFYYVYLYTITLCDKYILRQNKVIFDTTVFKYIKLKLLSLKYFYFYCSVLYIKIIGLFLPTKIFSLSF